MNNHTLGPWEAVDNPDDKLREIGMAAVIVDKTGNIVSYVFHDENGKPDMTEAMANADLIEAAPDLLKACKLALAFLSEIDEKRSYMPIEIDNLQHELNYAIRAKGYPRHE